MGFMGRTARIVRILGLMILVGALAACRNDGAAPKAIVYGFGEVFGTVTYGDGRPLVGAEVLVSRCGWPINGLTGQGRTEADGGYRVTAYLAPYEKIPGDTLHVSCVVGVQRGFAQAPVDVIFTKAGKELMPVRVDLTEGDSVPE